MDEDAEILDVAESPTTGCAVTNILPVVAADKQSLSPESKEKDEVDVVEIVNVESPPTGPAGTSVDAVEVSEKQSSFPESKKKKAVIVYHEIDTLQLYGMLEHHLMHMSNMALTVGPNCSG